MNGNCLPFLFTSGKVNFGEVQKTGESDHFNCFDIPAEFDFGEIRTIMEGTIVALHVVINGFNCINTVSNCYTFERLAIKECCSKVSNTVGNNNVPYRAAGKSKIPDFFNAFFD